MPIGQIQKGGHHVNQTFELARTICAGLLPVVRAKNDLAPSLATGSHAALRRVAGTVTGKVARHPTEAPVCPGVAVTLN